MVGTLGLGTPAVAARTAATQGTRSLLSMSRVLGAMRGLPSAFSKAGRSILDAAGKVVSRAATIVRETPAFLSRTPQVLRQAPGAIGRASVALIQDARFAFIQGVRGTFTLNEITQILGKGLSHFWNGWKNARVGRRLINFAGDTVQRAARLAERRGFVRGTHK